MDRVGPPEQLPSRPFAFLQRDSSSVNRTVPSQAPIADARTLMLNGCFTASTGWRNVIHGNFVRQAPGVSLRPVHYPGYPVYSISSRAPPELSGLARLARIALCRFGFFGIAAFVKHEQE